MATALHIKPPSPTDPRFDIYDWLMTSGCERAVRRSQMCAAPAATVGSLLLLSHVYRVMHTKYFDGPRFAGQIRDRNLEQGATFCCGVVFGFIEPG